jgi:hypothetical protein
MQCALAEIHDPQFGRAANHLLESETRFPERATADLSALAASEWRLRPGPAPSACQTIVSRVDQAERMRPFKRLAIALAAAGCLTLSVAATAAAHVIYKFDYVWENGSGKCLKGRVEISDGKSLDGYSKVNAFAQKEMFGIDCSVGWDRPARTIRVRTELQKWVPDFGWTKCTEGLKWKYNAEGESEVEQEHYWNPCGNGTYRIKGYSRSRSTASGKANR